MQSAPRTRQKWNKNGRSKILTDPRGAFEALPCICNATRLDKKNAVIHQEPFVGNSINEHRYVFNYLQQQTIVIISERTQCFTTVLSY